MQHILKLDIPKLKKPVSYTDKILLTGSCFTEHISERLAQHKFKVLSNPNGILFNPLSVADSLDSYVDNKEYTASELFYLNELWNSWDHHTRFSHIDQGAALTGINASQQAAAAFIRQADHLLITLGSAFQYYHREGNHPVANNHRAPGQWFEKRLLSIALIMERLSGTITKILSVNPGIQIIFTISPVRHIRDGVTENNRSKARLIEAVHELCGIFPGTCTYFPAYELLIDILRDYRYYDIDMVHPNFAATSYVWERFTESAIAEEAYGLMHKVADIQTAYRHRPRFPQTNAHSAFKKAYLDKCLALQQSHPFIDLTDEIAYFSATS